MRAHGRNPRILRDRCPRRPTIARCADFSGLSTTIYDPATGNSDGTARSPFPGNQIPAQRISLITQKLPALVPAPNTTVFGPYTNNFYGRVPIRYNLQKIDAKLDWVAGSRMRVTTPYKRTQTSIFGNTLGSGRDAHTRTSMARSMASPLRRLTS